MKRIQTGLISLLLIAGQVCAQSTLREKIQTAFNLLQADSQCRYGTVTLTVLDAKTGELMFAANSDVGVQPGSTMKTVTTITAFNVLGKDFQYQTQYGYTGKITNGTLNGDIIIKGSGDPTLGSWRWETTKQIHVLYQMVTAMQHAGIKNINGRIIGDDSAFGSQTIPDRWIWQDLGTYYGAGITALCWGENQFDLVLKTGRVNTPISIAGTIPAMPYLTFKSELINGTAGTGDNAYPFLPMGNSNLMYVRGTFAVDENKKTVSAALPDPAYDLAYRLTDTLKRIGITTSGQPESTTTITIKGQQAMPITTSLGAITSPELSKIVYWTNRKSINLYAEELLKAIALKSGLTASTADGVKVLHNFWKARGIDTNAMDIDDGCGLSPSDRITSRTIATVLQSAKSTPWFPDFYESLPVYNDMHMKSGSIHNVQAYAGYQTHQGRDLCFSIIVNNYNGSTKGIKDKMFKVLDELK
jgi:D-alanyl-D-alanine carboxypeptidase/D-alanyl-D-alanine-endopeptidase (penicillin-binding protein 4)